MARDRARRACRRCGLRRCASCARATTLTDEDMVRVAARQSARSDGAQPVGRDAAARIPAAQIRRPHPCDRGAQPGRPAERRRRSARRSMAGAWASCPTSCRASRSPRWPPRSSSTRSDGRRPDPAQARHLHVRRERARSLRAHDRDGHARRGAARAQPQGRVRRRATAAARRRVARGRADHARRLQPRRTTRPKAHGGG